VQHLASASFPKWEEFGKLCGRYWVMGKSGHGPRSVFESKIVDKDHPITKGLSNFKTDDELYAKLLGNEPIHVLVEAYSDWSKKTEPLVFWQEYGKGRMVQNAYGHDGKALATPEVKTIIIRGVEFAATGKVTAEK
jgi:type 1 glutamine amidotransferase